MFFVFPPLPVRFGYASGMVVVSTFEDDKTFTLNGETVTVEDSVALVGVLSLDQGPLTTITKWTGISALVVEASMVRVPLAVWLDGRPGVH